MSQEIQKTETLFGTDFINTTLDHVTAQIIKRAEMKIKTQVSFVNAHCFNIARKDATYRTALQNSDMILPDGSGVDLALKLTGNKLIENLNGTDLFPLLCEQAAQKGLKVFLLGGQEGIADKVADNMKKQNPDLIIAGTQHGFFKKEDTSKVIDRINASKADIVFVAFGVPLQENFLTEHKAAITASVTLAVGGLFDFFSNRIPRAPKLLRKAGLEWVYRLKQEPVRMWKRYVVGNPVYMAHAFAHAAQYWVQRAVKTVRA